MCLFDSDIYYYFGYYFDFIFLFFFFILFFDLYIVILGLLLSGEKNGRVSIGKAAAFFREYYSARKAQGLPIEKKRCIYLRDDVTDNQIVANLIANPVKALIESGYFFYDELSQVFSISPEIWKMADSSSKSTIAEICRQRLKDYYED